MYEPCQDSTERKLWQGGQFRRAEPRRRVSSVPALICARRFIINHTNISVNEEKGRESGDRARNCCFICPPQSCCKKKNYFPIKCHFFAVILDLPFYSLLSGPLRETARSQSDSAISTEQLALLHTHTHTHTHTHVAYFSLPEFPSPLPDSQYIPLSSLSGFTHADVRTYMLIHTGKGEIKGNN